MCTFPVFIKVNPNTRKFNQDATVTYQRVLFFSECRPIYLLISPWIQENYWSNYNVLVLQFKLKSKVHLEHVLTLVTLESYVILRTIQNSTIISMRVKENISWPHNVVIKYNAFVIIKSRLRLLFVFLHSFFFCIPCHIFPLKTLPIFVVSTFDKF